MATKKFTLTVCVVNWRWSLNDILTTGAPYMPATLEGRVAKMEPEPESKDAGAKMVVLKGAPNIRAQTIGNCPMKLAPRMVRSRPEDVSDGNPIGDVLITEGVE